MKIANVLLIIAVIFIIGSMIWSVVVTNSVLDKVFSVANGADMEQDSWISPSGSLVQQPDGSWVWNSNQLIVRDECKRIIDSLKEDLVNCQAGRRKEFEAYQRILRENNLLPPERK